MLPDCCLIAINVLQARQLVTALQARARHEDGAPVGGHVQPVRLNYYAYRAQDKDVSHSPEHLESVDLGNLAGVLTYLHHEVVQYSRCWPNEGPGIWRKFGIDRVTRYNVTSMCTAAAISVGVSAVRGNGTAVAVAATDDAAGDALEVHAAVPALARHGLCLLTVCGFCLNLMWTHKIVSMAFSEKRRKWLRKDAEQ